MRCSGITIRGKLIPVPIFQGGMGIGVSCPELSGTTAREEGIGTLSSAGLSSVYKPKSQYDALFAEIKKAQEIAQGNGAIAVNIMYALKRDFEQSVRASIDAGADMIVCGAGLPKTLPKIVDNADIALIPIISSVRGLKALCNHWKRYKRLPDAVVVEGSRAGGHLGFKYPDIIAKEESIVLEEIFPPIKKFAQEHGNFPVIVAGGIYTHADFITWLSRGADGVQLGTRFLATRESGATQAYKNAVMNCTAEEITIAHRDHNPPGSPSGMPFRGSKENLKLQVNTDTSFKCIYGHLLQKDANGKYTICPAKDDPANNFCICRGLLISCGAVKGDKPLYTFGDNAPKITEIISVKSLMNELKGEK